MKRSLFFKTRFNSHTGNVNNSLNKQEGNVKETESKVFGHGWLCHATQPRGQFTEKLQFINWLCYTRGKNANIKKVLSIKASIKIATFLKTETGSLADTYSYVDWQSLT